MEWFCGGNFWSSFGVVCSVFGFVGICCDVVICVDGDVGVCGVCVYVWVEYVVGWLDVVVVFCVCGGGVDVGLGGC